MVRVDRKGRVVEPAELGDSFDPADIYRTPVCLALFTMGRKRLKETDMLCTLLQLRALWGMGRDINHDAVCVITDWDDYYEGKECCLMRG